MYGRLSLSKQPSEVPAVPLPMQLPNTLGKAAQKAEASLWSLPPPWEILMEFEALGFGLA